MLLSILYFIMGHLSIDLSPHMHFPLILPYQTPCSCRFERRYDNYHNEAYLAIMLDIPDCNRRTSRRPVPWPWSLRFEQNKGTKLSWELIMTWSDMFDLIGLHAQMCTQTHPNAWITTRRSATPLTDGWNQLCWAEVLRVDQLMAWKSWLLIVFKGAFLNRSCGSCIERNWSNW